MSALRVYQRTEFQVTRASGEVIATCANVENADLIVTLLHKHDYEAREEFKMKRLHVVRRDALQYGECNFCDRREADVTEVQREERSGLRVRFCDTCLKQLLKATLPNRPDSGNASRGDSNE